MAHSYKIISATTEDTAADYVPDPAPPALTDVLPDRVENNIKTKFKPVCESQESPMSKSIDEDDLEYVEGRYRFDDGDSKDTICGVIENEVLNDAEWYIVKHHECDHDKDENVGCSGDTKICSKGTVPERFK